MKIKKFENFEYKPYEYEGCGCCPVCTGEKDCECGCSECNYPEDHYEYEDDDEFVITKIVEHFPFEEVKSRIEDESEDDKETALLDMIVWFRSQYGKEIKNEDYILDRLREEYDIN